MLFIANRRISSDTLKQRYGNAHIIDVTSRGMDPWIRFSPFYPHGNIPVPFSPDVISASVEGIWQGLKVFEQMISQKSGKNSFIRHCEKFGEMAHTKFQ